MTDLMPTEDHALVQRMADGDRDAIASLMDELGGAVWSLALRITADRGLAEETVQDTFVQAWTAAATYDPNTATVLTWLLGIARNKAIDRVRHEQRRRPRTADGSSAATVDSGEVDIVDVGAQADPIGTAWIAERSGVVRSALGELTPEQREVIELAYFSGLSQSEVAERIGVPLGTVKTRSHRALAFLRDLLAARGIDGGTT